MENLNFVNELLARFFELLLLIHIVFKILYDYKVLKPIENQLIQFYNHDDCTHFRRMDKTKLSLAACYVNLAVVPLDMCNPLESKDHKTFESDFIRPRSSEELISDKSNIIKLKNLFDKTDSKDKFTSNWKNVQTKRILIFGRAGIGKTTLCKKIVFSYYKKELWRDKFHRVVWISLRNLKHCEKKEYNVRAELSDVYNAQRIFLRKESGEIFTEMIKKEEGEGKRILYVLDGWDEIQELLVKDHFMRNVLLEELLRKPFLILTSRPYALGLEPSYFDEILETVGFTQKNVVKYIQNVIPNDSAEQNKVLTFINSHSVVAGIASIPIQLDMLCYLCKNRKDLQASIHTESVTMTKLYFVLVKKLLDVNQARKNEDTDWISLNLKEVLQAFKKNKSPGSFLAEVAYKGFLRNRIEFDDAFFAEMDNYSLDVTNMMKDSYFLNCLNPSESIIENKSYSFIHLTFQEFLAAIYIVNHLQDEEIVEIIAEHKYNPRFQIVWSFVAGLIDTSVQLDMFFKYLEMDPVEITGIPHQLLMINCVNECGLMLSKSTMDRLLEDMWKWLKSENWHLGAVQLPTRLYENVLTSLYSEDDKETMMIYEGYLGNTKWLPDSILSDLIDILYQQEFNQTTVNPNPLVIKKVERILSYKYRFISVKVAEKIELLLNNELNSPKRREGSIVRSKFLILLLCDCNLRDSAYETLLKLFDAFGEHFVRDVHRHSSVPIVKVVGNSSYKEDMLERLAELVDIKNGTTERKHALFCLRQIKKLPISMQNILADYFDSISNEQLNVNLQMQKFLSDHVINVMVDHLETNEKEMAKVRCLHVLHSRKELKETILRRIFAVFQNSSTSSRIKAKIVTVFEQQVELSEYIANSLLKVLQSQNEDDIQLHNLVCSVLQSPKIPQQTLEEIGILFNLYHQENNIENMLQILNLLKFKPYPQNMIESLCFRIENSEHFTELKEILGYLEFQTEFCNMENFSLLLLDLLEKSDILGTPIVNIFKRHQNLFFNEGVITKARDLLISSKEEGHVRINIIKVLAQCKNLPEGLVLKAISLLITCHSANESEKSANIKVLQNLLRNQTKLSKTIISHLLTMENWQDEKSYIKYSSRLVRHLPLPEITSNLDESNWQDVFDNIIFSRMKASVFPIPVIQIMKDKKTLAILTPQNEMQKLKHVSAEYAVEKLKSIRTLPFRPDILSLYLRFHTPQESLKEIQNIPIKVEGQVDLEEDFLYVFSNRLCKYVRLHLNKEKTTDADVKVLFEELKTQLRNNDFLHVDLQDNNLRNHNLQQLKDAIVQSGKRITTLILSENAITCSNSGLRILLETPFCTEIGLKYLFVDRNLLYLEQDESDNVTLRNSKYLLSTSGLEILDVSGNFIPEGKLSGKDENLMAEKDTLRSSGISDDLIHQNVNFIRQSVIINTHDFDNLENAGFIPISTHFYSLDIGYEKTRISKKEGCIILAFTKGYSKHAFIGIDWIPPNQADGHGQRQLIKTELLLSKEKEKHIKIKIVQKSPMEFISAFKDADIRAVLFGSTTKIFNLLQRIYNSRDTADMYTYKLTALIKDSQSGSFNCITWADIMLKDCDIIQINSMKQNYPILSFFRGFAKSSNEI